MNPRIFSVVAMAGILFVALSGCSKTVKQRVVARGTVTYQGEPISDGTISLIPSDPANHRTLGAEIKNGHYEILSDALTVIGKYRVEFQAYQGTGKRSPDLTAPDRNKASGGMVEQKVPFLPAKFNSDSQFSTEITAEGTSFDFEL